MDKLKVMTIFGTRPEAIKMAPLVKELENRPEFDSFCCVTAQHREMLDSVLDIFKIKPDFDLNIMEPGQTLSTITTKCLVGLEKVFSRPNRTWCWSMGTPPPPSPGRWRRIIRKSRWAT